MRRAVGADQTGAAPKGVGRCGEDRTIERVLPIARKFLPGDNPSGNRMAPPPFGGHNGAITRADAQPDAEIDGRRVQSPQRLDETKSGFLVGGKDVPGNSAALHRSQPDRLRFRNQIADCQNEAILTNQDAAPRALGAKSPGGERVLRDGRPQPENRTQRTV
jgi:hypothetical protein